MLPNLCGQQESAASRETHHYASLTSMNRWMNLVPTRQRACGYGTRSACSVLHSRAINISSISCKPLSFASGWKDVKRELVTRCHIVNTEDFIAMNKKSRFRVHQPTVPYHSSEQFTLILPSHLLNTPFTSYFLTQPLVYNYD
jgi:hypothetical protein